MGNRQNLPHSQLTETNPQQQNQQPSEKVISHFYRKNFARPFGGEVFIYASVGDSPKRVKVTLNQVQYKQANEAHLAGQNIEIGGKIQKAGRYLTIDSPTSF